MFFCDKLDRTEEELCRRKDFDFPLLKHDISIYSRLENSEHKNRNSPSEQKNRDCCECVGYRGAFAQNGASLNPKALDYHNLSSFSQKSGALPQKLQSMFFRSGQNRRCVVKSTCNSGTMCSTCGVFQIRIPST